MNIFGAVEAGGTKFCCAVGTGPEDLHAEVRLDTLDPVQTLAAVVDFFMQHRDGLTALGVGSFGPIDLRCRSATYGHITTTPKPGWSNTDIVGYLQRHLKLPVGFETDVAVSALGEARWGAAQGVGDFVYLTVGTGIGGAVVSNDQIVHGLLHPEIGHMRIPRVPGDTFAGVCKYHGDCLEGLASGPALKERWQMDPSKLPADHIAWQIQAQNIAASLVNLILTTSPRRIILGGGVMVQQHLLPLIHQHVLQLLNQYLHADELSPERIQNFIVSPGLGDRAGILGGLLLAEMALKCA
ncbi:MAG: ROK family protein [Planctomycetes bacterium]|nr:ROK family protein [Planctomycetota bacterium]